MVIFTLLIHILLRVFKPRPLRARPEGSRDYGALADLGNRAAVAQVVRIAALSKAALFCFGPFVQICHKPE